MEIKYKLVQNYLIGQLKKFKNYELDKSRKYVA